MPTARGTAFSGTGVRIGTASSGKPASTRPVSFRVIFLYYQIGSPHRQALTERLLSRVDDVASCSPAQPLWRRALKRHHAWRHTSALKCNRSSCANQSSSQEISEHCSLRTCRRLLAFHGSFDCSAEKSPSFFDTWSKLYEVNCSKSMREDLPKQELLYCWGGVLLWAFDHFNACIPWNQMAQRHCILAGEGLQQQQDLMTAWTISMRNILLELLHSLSFQETIARLQSRYVSVFNDLSKDDVNCYYVVVHWLAQEAIRKRFCKHARLLSSISKVAIMPWVHGS